MKKHVIRIAFAIVGAAVGFYYLPLLWNAFNIQLTGTLLFASDLVIGAVVFLL